MFSPSLLQGRETAHSSGSSHLRKRANRHRGKVGLAENRCADSFGIAATRPEAGCIDLVCWADRQN